MLSLTKIPCATSQENCALDEEAEKIFLDLRRRLVECDILPCAIVEAGFYCLGREWEVGL